MYMYKANLFYNFSAWFETVLWWAASVSLSAVPCLSLAQKCNTSASCTVFLISGISKITLQPFCTAEKNSQTVLKNYPNPEKFSYFLQFELMNN